MALEVIGAGYGRTGTISLKLALEQLGFGPCHHMVEVLEKPELAPFWNRVCDGEDVDWEEIYGTYHSTVDWPSCVFYDRLADRYPDAKVILSRRDPEGWYESMSKTILQSLAMMGLDKGEEVPADHPFRFGGITISTMTFGGDFSKENVIAAFKRHEREVRAKIPADRLLVFEASQGWEPLCDFLGVPVPQEPYPRTNAPDEFWTHADKAIAQSP